MSVSNKMEEDVPKATWNQTFFKKKDLEDINYAGNFQALNNGMQTAFKWDYMNPVSGKLGKREVKYNRNLLAPKNFAHYWQTGKHRNYEIYNNLDVDGDGFTDMIAVNPADKRVEGFNERYVSNEGKGETPYRRDYYKLEPEERKKISYMEYLDTQNPVPGWRDISKIKENRKLSVAKIIETALESELNTAGATKRESENVAKGLLRLIQTVFFSTEVPSYQMRAITETPEFKKLLKQSITSSTVKNYFPEDKQKLVNGMLQAIRGYGDNVKQAYIAWLLTNHNNQRISKENAEALYKSVIIKHAANNLYRKFGLTAAEAANNSELFTAYKGQLQTEQVALEGKYKTQEYEF